MSIPNPNFRSRFALSVSSELLRRDKANPLQRSDTLFGIIRLPGQELLQRDSVRITLFSFESFGMNVASSLAGTALRYSGLGQDHLARFREQHFGNPADILVLHRPEYHRNRPVDEFVQKFPQCRRTRRIVCAVEKKPAREFQPSGMVCICSPSTMFFDTYCEMFLKHLSERGSQLSHFRSGDAPTARAVHLHILPAPSRTSQSEGPENRPSAVHFSFAFFALNNATLTSRA